MVIVQSIILQIILIRPNGVELIEVHMLTIMVALVFVMRAIAIGSVVLDVAFLFYSFFIVKNIFRKSQFCLINIIKRQLNNISFKIHLDKAIFKAL